VIFTPGELDGAYLIDLQPHADERGFFARTFCEEEMRAHGLESHVAQCNVSWNEKRGTLRGLHYQAAPHEETKIVRCTRGAIWDVIVDLRTESRTYRTWMAVELNEDNRRMLYVPHGFAHGFITLSDGAEVFYWMGSPFVPGTARGVAWNDPQFGIAWPIEPVVMSEADRAHRRWEG
jgi:dTDP-4-dehydrorhamnose 3,5-epimerase